MMFRETITQRQRGSHHILIVVVILVLLIGTIGVLFWQNFVGAKDIGLGQEFRVAARQKVKINGTNDTFMITSMYNCPSDPNQECGIRGPYLDWEITTDKGVTSSSNMTKYSQSGTPPSQYNVTIVDTDRTTYAVVRITHNPNWQELLAEHDAEVKEYNREKQESEAKVSAEAEMKMSSAKTVTFDKEFLAYPGNIFKVVNGKEVYYLEIKEPFSYPNEQQFNYEISQDTMDTKGNSFGGFARPGCEHGYRPGPLTDKFMVIETDYISYAKMKASNSLPSFSMSDCD